MTPDLIISGRIATLAGDDGLGWVEAVAIGGGRVVAAGAWAEVSALGSGTTVRWRLGSGLVVLPGITDAHLHLASAAQAALDLDLGDVTDRVEVLERLRARHQQMSADGDTDGWLFGHGWSLDVMGTWPTAEDLEAVAPGRRAALWSHDHHSRWLSGPALRGAHIGRDTPDPPGGIIRRDAHGQPTGILHEHAAKLPAAAIPRPSDDRLAHAVALYAARLAESGVVAVQDPGEMSDDPELRWGPTFFRSLARSGRLPLRVTASIRPEQLARAIERRFRSGETAAGRYRGGWLKLFADGALGSRSAALLAPYEPARDGRQPVGGTAGMLLDAAEVLRERASQAAAAGIAVQIHGIGDAAVRTALDILEDLPRSPLGVRHRVEHAQLVDPTDIPRFGARGIVASVQPSHIASDAAIARLAWGKRTEYAFPLRSLADAGALLAFGTDAPVESPDPWPGIAMAVTRTHASWASEGPFHGEQSISLADALRAVCLLPALSAGEEDRGRLVAGHRADLVVVDAAAVDEPVRPGGALASARPRATMIDGELVYADATFDPGG